jgi:predicted permease
VALLLFGQQAEGVYILIVLGLSLYENSLGYYMTARGRYTAQEALRQVARLPTTHAFLMGLIVKLLGLPIPHIMQDFFVRIQGTYSTLGMMIIGLGLSSMRRFRIDQRFLCTALLVRFVAWPALILTLVTLDRQLFHIYAPSIHQAFILASIVPLAANTVIFASLLEAQPEKSATAVLISTLIAMLYVPFMASLLL